MSSDKKSAKIIIIGAGPGGLTAAYWLQTRFNIQSHIYESSSAIGGISQTVKRDGWRFDLGGHRFFTKLKIIDDLWHEILPTEDFLKRPRLSRIYFKNRFFDYPLRPINGSLV